MTYVPFQLVSHQYEVLKCGLFRALAKSFVFSLTRGALIATC